MPLLGVFIFAAMVGLTFLGVALVASLIWAVFWLPRKRNESYRLSKMLYLQLSSIVAIVIVVMFLAAKWNHLSAPPAGNAGGYVDISSPTLTPFQTMYAVAHAKYGFTPLPKHARVDIEKRTGADAISAGYDAMLHIYSSTVSAASTERTVSFKLVQNKYQWIGEQEVWTGPDEYKLADGSSAHESISITYETQPGDGFPPVNTLQVLYFGNNPQLSGKRKLSLKNVQPVLKGWGAL